MKQKINMRLSLIALIAIIMTAIGLTLVYYNLFQVQVRDDLKQSARILVETEVFQKAYTSGKEDAESLDKLSFIWTGRRSGRPLRPARERAQGVLTR